MSKYHVHVFPVVRMLFKDIEADSMEDACQTAEQKADLGRWGFRWGFQDIEYADEISHFLVDVDGDMDHEWSAWYLADYTPMPKNWPNLPESKAAPDLLAALEDLLDQLEGIGVPDWHGAEGLSLEQARAAIAKAKGQK